MTEIASNPDLLSQIACPDGARDCLEICKINRCRSIDDALAGEFDNSSKQPIQSLTGSLAGE